jgi:hypothetical protein
MPISDGAKMEQKDGKDALDTWAKAGVGSAFASERSCCGPIAYVIKQASLDEKRRVAFDCIQKCLLIRM